MGNTGRVTSGGGYEIYRLGMVTMTRINVGCGMTPTKGWKNIDNSLGLVLARIPVLPALLHKTRLLNEPQYEVIQFGKSNKMVEYADATRGLPLSSGSVDVLYSSHMLEHLDQVEVTAFLKEARRVLCPRGIIRIVVPDLHKQVCQYLEDKDADAFISGTCLCEPRPKSMSERLRILLVGTRNHQWMYDGSSLCRLLLKHGLSNASVVQAGETRITNPEPLDLWERYSESVYVEAENP